MSDFDELLSRPDGKINVIPQDIGRVLLNLLNNAFYAVNEKKKTAPASFDPLVSLSTKKMSGTRNDSQVISDNGKWPSP